MIEIDNVYVSEELFGRRFACELNACKGACCVEGDGGAPLEKEEAAQLETLTATLEPYLDPAGWEDLQKKGPWQKETWLGKEYYSTSLVGRKGACVYAIFENGIALCGIEKAWKAGAVPFRKPISCHLYPIRIAELDEGAEVLQYHKWSVCTPACKNGEKLDVPVYRFLREALERKYGRGFFRKLEKVAEAWEKHQEYPR